MPFFGFEGQSSGAPLTSAAAAGEDTLTAVTSTSGAASLTGSIEQAHAGAMSCRVQCASGSAVMARYTGTSSVQGAVRWYMYLNTAIGTTDTFPIEVYSQAGGGYVMRFAFLNTGRGRIKAPAIANAYTTPVTVPIGEWVRCDLWYNITQGRFRFTMASGESESLLADSGVIAGDLGSRIPDGLRFGKTDSGQATEVYFLDSLTYEPGAPDILGPTVVTNRPTVTLAPGRPALDAGEVTTITATATDMDGTITSYTWSTTAGELAGSGAITTLRNTPSRTDRTATVTCTVTDDVGGETSAIVGVELLQAARKVVLGGAMLPVVRRVI